MLSEEPSTHAQKCCLQILSYLKKYIRCPSRKELELFLRYIMGSSLRIVESMKVLLHVNKLGSLPHPMAGFQYHMTFLVKVPNTAEAHFGRTHFPHFQHGAGSGKLFHLFTLNHDTT